MHCADLIPCALPPEICTSDGRPTFLTADSLPSRIRRVQVNSHHSIGIDLLDDLLDFTRHREWEVAVVEAVLERISLMGKLPLKSEQPECERIA